jgi:hypothetical protein
MFTAAVSRRFSTFIGNRNPLLSVFLSLKTHPLFRLMPIGPASARPPQPLNAPSTPFHSVVAEKSQASSPDEWDRWFTSLRIVWARRDQANDDERVRVHKELVMRERVRVHKAKQLQ